jgi:hypothetical protein
MLARIIAVTKTAVALPLYQIANLVAYASTRQGWWAKLGTVAAFLPIFAFTTVCWVTAWTVGLWLLWKLVNS